MTPVSFTVTVRELAEFVHKKGNLKGEGGLLRADRAMQGIQGHKRLQNSRGDGYQAEVPVERTVEWKGIRLLLRGRVDGVREGENPLIEEIKTVDARWTPKADPVHLAQLRLYGGMVAVEKNWKQVSLQLTYLEMGSDQTTIFREAMTREQLEEFTEETLTVWFSWLSSQVDWLQRRDDLIRSVPFPFTDFRKGQRDLATSVYRAIRDKKNIFIEAPTGLGKTLATVYPAIKALPMVSDGKIFYVTAKNSGHQAIAQALDRLCSSGLRLRSVHLTAKQKICFSNTPTGCDMRSCPYAVGYYDRIKPAVRELLGMERMDRQAVEQVAQKHQVCPFELSLDASPWADLIVGDYNYVFDPLVRLKRFFDGEITEHIVLIDEAHNLVDRSRDMYSASIEVDELTVEQETPSGKESRQVLQTLRRARKELLAFLNPSTESFTLPRPHHRGTVARGKPPEVLFNVIKKATADLESFFASQPLGSDLSAWLKCYFALHGFLQTGEAFDNSYRTIVNFDKKKVTLFCLDPSQQLAKTLKQLRSAIFFSATLSPLSYFIDVLGGTPEDRRAQYPSPFRADQMNLNVAEHDLSFRGREGSVAAVAQEIKQHLSHNPGNHLIFCPSLNYIEILRPYLEKIGVQVVTQSVSMVESSREEFMGKFTNNRNSIGLVVLGGIFSEGIDLPGEQLIGVTVIGVGLPGLSLERDLLMDYYDKRGKNGFEYAYQFPGIQRVIQAAGRLIRTDTDTGSVLLIDQRFRQRRYTQLLPAWWRLGNDPVGKLRKD